MLYINTNNLKGILGYNAGMKNKNLSYALMENFC